MQTRTLRDAPIRTRLAVIEEVLTTSSKDGRDEETSTYTPGFMEEEQSDSSFSDNATGIPLTDDAVLPADSLVAVYGREKLENDILFVAASRVVQMALMQYVQQTIWGSQSNMVCCTIARAATGGKEWAQAEFVRGVRMMIEASCDRRLEISHWMLGMLWEDREEVSGLDLMEWFFEEARQLVLEMHEDEAMELERVFGLE